MKKKEEKEKRKILFVTSSLEDFDEAEKANDAEFPRRENLECPSRGNKPLLAGRPASH